MHNLCNTYASTLLTVYVVLYGLGTNRRSSHSRSNVWPWTHVCCHRSIPLLPGKQLQRSFRLALLFPTTQLILDNWGFGKRHDPTSGSSIDRYVAICWFNKYMEYGRSYAIKLACYSYVWVVLLFVLFFVDTYINARNEMDLPVCWDYTRFTDYGFTIYWGYLLGTSLTACLTYLVVMCSLKRQAKLNVSHTSQQQANFSYQTRVTKLLAIVTVFTGLLFVSPCVLYFAMRFRSFSWWIGRNVMSIDPLTTGLVCIMSLNSATNIVIYFVKNIELRNAIKDLWCFWRSKHNGTVLVVRLLHLE